MVDETLLTDIEEQNVRRDLKAAVTSLYQTRQMRDRQPEQFDEALNAYWYLEKSAVRCR